MVPVLRCTEGHQYALPVMKYTRKQLGLREVLLKHSEQKSHSIMSYASYKYNIFLPNYLFPPIGNTLQPLSFRPPFPHWGCPRMPRCRGRYAPPTITVPSPPPLPYNPSSLHSSYSSSSSPTPHHPTPALPLPPLLQPLAHSSSA